MFKIQETGLRDSVVVMKPLIILLIEKKKTFGTGQ